MNCLYLYLTSATFLLSLFFLSYSPLFLDWTKVQLVKVDFSIVKPPVQLLKTRWEVVVKSPGKPLPGLKKPGFLQLIVFIPKIGFNQCNISSTTFCRGMYLLSRIHRPIPSPSEKLFFYMFPAIQLSRELQTDLQTFHFVKYICG